MIKKVNPIAKALVQLKKYTKVVPHKKGKGSYDRAKEKRKAKEGGQETQS